MISNNAVVMKALYWGGGEMNVKQIMKDTGLKRGQVYTAIRELHKRCYIKKRLFQESNGLTIKRELFVKLSNPVLAEKSLKKWGAL